jgi:preprotein translocase subunit SecE
VARETRRQRRAARAADGAAPAGGRRSRAQQVRPSAQPVKQQTGRRATQPRGQFVRESAAELRKVDWPNRAQTFQGVVVVIIACVIVAAYLYGLDQIFRPMVRRII